MFTFTAEQNYRHSVYVELHAILNVVPNLEGVLKGIPTLANAINELKASNVSPAEAAVHLSVIVLETLTRPIPLQTRSIILGHITTARKEGFVYFVRIGRALKMGEVSAYPEGMPLLAVIVGHALWYLDTSERQGNISSLTQKLFVADISGMLMGKTPEELAAARGKVFSDEISGRAGRLYD